MITGRNERKETNIVEALLNDTMYTMCLKNTCKAKVKGYLVLAVVTLLTCASTYIIAKLIHQETNKIAIILDENLLMEFENDIKEYKVIIVDREYAEIISYTVTKELYNFSFYSPMILLFKNPNQLEGIIIGYPSRLLKEKIRECLSSQTCRPFVASSVPSPYCEYCPRSYTGDRIEIIDRLPEEKCKALVYIIKSRLKF